MTINPLVIEEAGVPGAPNSYYSEVKTLATPGAGADTLVPEIGFIIILAAAGVLWEIQTDDSPQTFTTIVAANTNGFTWSDGTNIFVSASGGAASASYIVCAHKP